MAKVFFTMVLASWAADSEDSSEMMCNNYQLTTSIDLPFRPSFGHDYIFPGGIRAVLNSVAYIVGTDGWEVSGTCWIDAGTLTDALACARARGWSVERLSR